MNALAKAIKYAIDVEIELNKDNEYVIAQAALIQAYATIAQVEQLKRIADMLEGNTSTWKGDGMFRATQR